MEKAKPIINPSQPVPSLNDQRTNQSQSCQLCLGDGGGGLELPKA